MNINFHTQFLGLLDGHFVIDVYDGAYAEAHVGLINFHVDIVKAYICFNGHIKYDLNILKVKCIIYYKKKINYQLIYLAYY